MQTTSNTLDPIQNLYDACQQQGRETAATTGDQKPDLARMATAQRTIDASVKALWIGPIDTGDRKDAALLDSFDESKEELRRAGTSAEQAQKKAREAQDSTPAQEPPPDVPLLVVLLAILALAGTFSLSLVELDIFSQIDDVVLRLGAAALLGLAIAGTCIASLFDLSVYNKDASVVRPKATRELYSLIAGLVMSAAFGFIRFSNSDDDIVLTMGLVFIDVAVLTYAKSSAAQHRNRVTVYAERNDARLQFMKKRDDALQELEASLKKLAEAEAKHDSNIASVDLRNKLDFDPSVVSKGAFAQWEDGYFRGLDDNRNPNGPSLFRANRRSAA